MGVADWWTHLLVTGTALCIVPTLLLLACLKWAWPAFEQDYPDDVRALLPQPTRAEVIGSRVLGPLFLITLLAALIAITAAWEPARSNFLDAVLMAFAAVVLFCLIDVLIVDWLIVCFWRPSWVTPRGTEEAAGWGDYWFHVRAQFSPKGLAVMVIGPLLIALVVTVVW